MFNMLKPKSLGRILFYALFLGTWAFAEELTSIELPERPDPDTTETDSSSGDWFGSPNDSTQTDTVEYHAVDLQYDV